MSAPAVDPFEVLTPAGTCERCGRSVLWARLGSGLPIPLEQQPDARGVIAVVRARWGLAARMTTPAKPRQPYETPFVPHLALCERSPMLHPAARPGHALP